MRNPERIKGGKSLPGGGGRFATTHWSLVLGAGRRGSAESRRALATLCEAYWFPLYAFVRRQGYSSHDAQDFFARVLEKGYLAVATPDEIDDELRPMPPKGFALSACSRPAWAPATIRELAPSRLRPRPSRAGSLPRRRPNWVRTSRSLKSSAVGPRGGITPKRRNARSRGLLRRQHHRGLLPHRRPPGLVRHAGDRPGEDLPQGPNRVGVTYTTLSEPRVPSAVVSNGATGSLHVRPPSSLRRSSIV